MSLLVYIMHGGLSGETYTFQSMGGGGLVLLVGGPPGGGGGFQAAAVALMRYVALGFLINHNLLFEPNKMILSCKILFDSASKAVAACKAKTCRS